MATKLFLRETVDNAINGFRDMLTTAGTVTTDGIVNTVASGTEIQWTDTAGGAVLEWISGRAPSGGFTLAGTMTFSIWARENNMSANCGARARVFKRTAAGAVTEINGGWNDGVEFGTAFAEMVWTGAPTSTAFAENDRIIVRYYITNIGTMGGGFTCTINYDAADAVNGDSFFQINETVTFKAEDAPAIVGTASITEDDDTVVSAGVAPISATLGPTEADDTIAATGGLPILEGDAALTEADDALVSAAVLPLAGAAFITEDGDAVSSSGILSIAGVASVTEADDTTVSAAVLTIVGSASLTEDGDSISSAAALAVAGLLSATEEGDGLSSNSGLAIVGAAGIAEADDTLSATGDLAAGGEGSLAVTEEADGLASTATTNISGLLAANENDDGLVSEGTLRIVGGLDYSEDGDTLGATGFLAVPGANIPAARIVAPSPIGRVVRAFPRVNDLEVAMGSRTVRPSRRLP